MVGTSCCASPRSADLEANAAHASVTPRSRLGPLGRPEPRVAEARVLSPKEVLELQRSIGTLSPMVLASLPEATALDENGGAAAPVPTIREQSMGAQCVG